MTVWQKIAGFATALGGAGGSLLHEVANVFGFDRESAPEKERRLHDRRHCPQRQDGQGRRRGLAARGATRSAASFNSRRRRPPTSRVSSTSPSRIRPATRPTPTRSRPCSATTAGCCSTCWKVFSTWRRPMAPCTPRRTYSSSRWHTRFGFADNEYRFFRARFVRDGGQSLRRPEASPVGQQCRNQRAVPQARAQTIIPTSWSAAACRLSSSISPPASSPPSMPPTTASPRSAGCDRKGGQQARARAAIPPRTSSRGARACAPASCFSTTRASPARPRPSSGCRGLIVAYRATM